MITKCIVGTKGESSQTFDDGMRIPVTEIHTEPCYVVDIRSKEKDGYWAVLLGFGTTKNIKKPREGLLKKAGIKTPLHFLTEVRLDEAELIDEKKQKGLKIGELTLMVGDKITPESLFAEGDAVQVTGISKGKGFQGVVKRHGFAGGPRTHGQSDRERAPGSIGMTTTPGRVFKGKKMAGRMGGETTTVKNLRVIAANDSSLIIQGLVPGPKGEIITVRSSAPYVPVQQNDESQEEPQEKE